jgi:predicted nuclease of predicted toxin-antitoxin system
VRVLLDENIPVDLAALLTGHDVQTVSGLRWQGLKNGELLERAGGRFEAFVTMDRNIKQQQALADRSFGVVLLRAPSNRIAHLRPLVPALREALNGLKPGQIVRVGA